MSEGAISEFGVSERSLPLLSVMKMVRLSGLNAVRSDLPPAVLIGIRRKPLGAQGVC